MLTQSTTADNQYVVPKDNIDQLSCCSRYIHDAFISMTGFLPMALSST
jgi:hypothetical protein